MNIELANLPLGTWRDLTPQEVGVLQEAVSNSDNCSFAAQAPKEATITPKKTTPTHKSSYTEKEIGTNGRRRRGRNT